MSTARFGGITPYLHYEDAGSGPPVVPTVQRS